MSEPVQKVTGYQCRRCNHVEDTIKEMRAHATKRHPDEEFIAWEIKDHNIMTAIEGFDYERNCVACDFIGSPEDLTAHYEKMCGPNGDDLHRVWV